MLIQSSPNPNSTEKYKTQHSRLNILISVFPPILFIFFLMYFLLKLTYRNQDHSSFCLGNILSLIWTCLQASVSACSVSVAHIPQFSRLENSTGKHPSADHLSCTLSSCPHISLGFQLWFFRVLQLIAMPWESAKATFSAALSATYTKLQHLLPAMSYLIPDSWFLLGNPAHHFPFSFLLM